MDVLIEKSLKGDRVAFDQLIKEYSPTVTAAVYQTFYKHNFRFDRDDVEDLHNSFFLALMENDFKKIRLFKEISSFKTYLRVLAIRHVIDFLRRQKNNVSIESSPVPIEPVDPGAPADEIITVNQEAKVVRNLIHMLHPDEQLLLKLAFYQDQSAGEISKIMNISIVAFYNKKSRLIKKLRKKCEESLP